MNSLIIKQFIRNRGVKSGLLLLFFIGILSLMIGKQFVAKQAQAVAETVKFQQEHIDRNVQYHQAEMGLLLYYLRFALVNEPNPLNALSIGQRDVNASIQSLTIRGLENQKYDTDLNNPLNLLLGNLDFSFVIIYLFPLLIIAFTYNILSEEKEEGTWRLVAAQTPSVLGYLFQKMGVRAGAVFSIFFALIFTAFLYQSIPLSISTFSFILTAILYLLFWFSISFWVVAQHKSSGFNAVALLSIWLFLTILIPATLNNYLINKYPVPEALTTVLKQREGYHEKWDMPQKPTVEKFYAHYPQFQKYPLPKKTFNWLWYYAMQQMGDDDSRQEAMDLKTKLRQRDEASSNIALIIPTLHTQLIFNDLANAGLKNQLQYLDATEAFHEKKRLYFYPKIFEEQDVKSENWAQFKVEFFRENPTINGVKMFLPLILMSGLFMVLGVLRLKKPYEVYH